MIADDFPIRPFVYIQVVYAKLHKAAEKKGHKLEKIQESWYPGKLINQCTGKHTGKVEDMQKMFEEMKVAEETKAQELQTADKDREQAVASLNVTFWPRSLCGPESPDSAAAAGRWWCNLTE